ncbi:MAG: hypothetical protein M1840_006148 [Geoglossum simile]|nr:MAG: hypothetical protein M1840_006148 [Geoglossum simile]
MRPFTDEECRFIYWYATLTHLTPYKLASIFSSQFFPVSERSITFAVSALDYGTLFGVETLALCEEDWAEPAFFGLEEEVWK